jgi:hypothetical protein
VRLSCLSEPSRRAFSAIITGSNPNPGERALKLSPGRFLGVPVKTRSVSGFIFTEYLYGEGAVIGRHCHELAYFSLVLSGSYVEHCSQKQVRHCDSENVLYHPEGEAHSDTFGDRGGAIFSMELEPKWTSTLREYELQAEESFAFAAARSPGWRGGHTRPSPIRTADPLCCWRPQPSSCSISFPGSLRHRLSLAHRVG